MKPVISNNSPLVALWRLDLLSLWIKTIDLTDSESIPVNNRLDPGEVSVLALAKKHEAQFVIIDEKKGATRSKQNWIIAQGYSGCFAGCKRERLD